MAMEFSVALSADYIFQNALASLTAAMALPFYLMLLRSVCTTFSEKNIGIKSEVSLVLAVADGGAGWFWLLGGSIGMIVVVERR